MTVAVGHIHNGEVKAAFMRSLYGTLQWDFSHQLLIRDLISMESADIIKNRNTVVAAFLKTNNSWLWFVDSDMSFAPDTLQRLIDVASVSRPIMAAMAFSQVDDSANYPVPVWYALDGEGNYRYVRGFGDEPMRLAAVGMACCLIHRSVFERLADAYGGDDFTWYGRDQVILDGKRQRLGEDFTFCYRCARLEIPIWGHAGVRIGHLKTVELGYDQFAAKEKSLGNY